MDQAGRQRVLEHARDPHHWGELETPTVRVVADNGPCGDRLELALTVDDDRIAEIAFSGLGCSVSVAAASMTADVVRGMSLQSALALDRGFVLDVFGVPVAEPRLGCALLHLEALKRAVEQASGL